MYIIWSILNVVLYLYFLYLIVGYISVGRSILPKDKQAIQKLVFPDGIAYNRKTDTVQTNRVNAVFELTHSLSKVLTQKESEQKLDDSNLSALVTMAGFKPATS